jgi:hypothetical protein
VVRSVTAEAVHHGKLRVVRIEALFNAIGHVDEGIDVGVELGRHHRRCRACFVGHVNFFSKLNGWKEGYRTG